MQALPAGWDVSRLTRLAGQVSDAATRQPDDGGQSRWLHGPHYTDLFVDFNAQGQIVHVEISFAGHFLRWEPDRLFTGATDEMQINEGMPGSRFVREHAHPDPAIVNAVRELVGNLPDRALGQSLLSTLRRPVKAEP